MALLKLTLPLLFIILSFGELFRVEIYPGVSTGVIDFVLVIVLGIWLIRVKKSRYSLRNALLLFVFLAAFSLLINLTRYSAPELAVSLLYLLRFILYSSMYFVFKDIGKEFRFIIPRYMALAGCLFLGIGIIQYILYPSLKNLYSSGWDMHVGRLFSAFLDPNFAGAFLVLFFVFIYIARDKIFPKKWIKASYLLLTLNFIAIILTYSRGALLMLLVCVVSYSALTKNWKLTAGLIGAFVVIFVVLSPKFNMESTNLLRMASVEARIESTKVAVNIWKQNPMGVGFNTYRYAREKYGDIDTSKFGLSHGGAGVDNSFIFVLVTSGVLGLAAYLFLIYKIFRLGFNNIKKNKFALVLVVSIIGISANALFINSLFYSFIMLWIFILAGFTESSERE